MSTGKVCDEVWAERRRQDQKWGEQNHDPRVWISILAEEVGEAATESNDLARFDLLDSDRQRLERERRLRAELIQVAAVAVAAIECLDRRKP